MEVHQLKYFLEVARRRHFGRAASACRVAQPSLSQQIKKLEHELGERLFDRLRTGVALTEPGRLFLPHAERVLAEVAAASEVLEGARGRIRGVVRVGAIPTLSPYVLPKALHVCAGRYPELSIVGHEDLTASLVQAVESQELDLALVSLPVQGRQLVTEEIGSEELWLALPKRHALARHRRVPDAAVGTEPFMLMKEGHCLAGQVLEVCEARAVDPQVSFRSAQIETLKEMIAAGQGVSFIPLMACSRHPGIVYRRLSGPAPVRRLGLVRSRGRQETAALKAVATAIREEVRARLSAQVTVLQRSSQ